MTNKNNKSKTERPITKEISALKRHSFGLFVYTVYVCVYVCVLLYLIEMGRVHRNFKKNVDG